MSDVELINAYINGENNSSIIYLKELYYAFLYTSASTKHASISSFIVCVPNASFSKSAVVPAGIRNQSRSATLSRKYL